MRSYRLLLSVLVLIGVVVAGCAQSTAVGEDTSQVSGAIRAGSGRTVPPSAHVATVWTVSAGSPDYGYVYGGGVSSGDRYGLEFDDDLPPEATNRGLGVGIVLLTT